MKKLFSWTILWFLLATFSLSRVLEASRALTGGLPNASGVTLGVWLLVLLVAMVALAYDVYQREKAKGTPVREVKLFNFIQRQLALLPLLKPNLKSKP